MIAQTDYENIGLTLARDERELIEDLGRRMGTLWECERYIARAEGRPELQEYWRGARSQEQRNIDQLKKLIE